MRQVSNVALSVVAQARDGVLVAPVSGQLAQQERAAQAGKVINQLFRELRTIRTAWRQAWPDKKAYLDSKATWLKAFIENGICTQEQIDVGLARCRAEDSDFIPSPGRFIAGCVPTPEMVGLPPVETAYEQALRNCHPAMRGSEKWFHPAVYHATAAAGFHSLPLLSREMGMASFAKRYQAQVNKVWRGEDLDPLPVAELPAPVPVRNPKVGNAALAELRARRAGVGR
jgi:hypothetical protein